MMVLLVMMEAHALLLPLAQRVSVLVQMSIVWVFVVMESKLPKKSVMMETL